MNPHPYLEVTWMCFFNLHVRLTVSRTHKIHIDKRIYMKWTKKMVIPSGKIRLFKCAISILLLNFKIKSMLSIYFVY